MQTIDTSKTDTAQTVKFIKACLKDNGHSKELISYLFSTYDLESFISSSAMNKLELATHFLKHARQIDLTSTTF